MDLGGCKKIWSFFTLSMKQASYSICYARNIDLNELNFFFGQILYNLKF